MTWNFAEEEKHDKMMEEMERYYKGAADCRQAFKEALANPSCSTCSHGVWEEDRSVGIWLHLADCPHWPLDEAGEELSLEEEYDSDEDFYLKMATKCGHYTIEPDMVGPHW